MIRVIAFLTEILVLGILGMAFCLLAGFFWMAFVFVRGIRRELKSRANGGQEILTGQE